MIISSSVDKVAEEIYIESLEVGTELTDEEREGIQKASYLFHELRADLPPYLVKKLFDYDALVGVTCSPKTGPQEMLVTL